MPNKAFKTSSLSGPFILKKQKKKNTIKQNYQLGLTSGSILSSQFGRQLLVSLTLAFSLVIKLIYIASESNLQIVMSWLCLVYENSSKETEHLPNKLQTFTWHSRPSIIFVHFKVCSPLVLLLMFYTVVKPIHSIYIS